MVTAPLSDEEERGCNTCSARASARDRIRQAVFGLLGLVDGDAVVGAAVGAGADVVGGALVLGAPGPGWAVVTVGVTITITMVVTVVVVAGG